MLFFARPRALCVCAVVARCVGDCSCGSCDSERWSGLLSSVLRSPLIPGTVTCHLRLLAATAAACCRCTALQCCAEEVVSAVRCRSGITPTDSCPQASCQLARAARHTQSYSLSYIILILQHDSVTPGYSKANQPTPPRIVRQSSGGPAAGGCLQEHRAGSAKADMAGRRQAANGTSSDCLEACPMEGRCISGEVASSDSELESSDTFPCMLHLLNCYAAYDDISVQQTTITTTTTHH